MTLTSVIAGTTDTSTKPRRGSAGSAVIRPPPGMVANDSGSHIRLTTRPLTKEIPMNEIDREATDPYIEMRDARDNLMAQLAALRDVAHPEVSGFDPDDLYYLRQPIERGNDGNG